MSLQNFIEEFKKLTPENQSLFYREIIDDSDFDSENGQEDQSLSTSNINLLDLPDWGKKDKVTASDDWGKVFSPIISAYNSLTEGVRDAILQYVDEHSDENMSETQYASFIRHMEIVALKDEDSKLKNGIQTETNRPDAKPEVQTWISERRKELFESYKKEHLAVDQAQGSADIEAKITALDLKDPKLIDILDGAKTALLDELYNLANNSDTIEAYQAGKEQAYAKMQNKMAFAKDLDKNFEDFKNNIQDLAKGDGDQPQVKEKLATAMDKLQQGLYIIAKQPSTTEETNAALEKVKANFCKQLQGETSSFWQKCGARIMDALNTFFAGIINVLKKVAYKLDIITPSREQIRDKALEVNAKAEGLDVKTAKAAMNAWLQHASTRQLGEVMNKEDVKKAIKNVDGVTEKNIGSYVTLVSSVNNLMADQFPKQKQENQDLAFNATLRKPVQRVQEIKANEFLDNNQETVKNTVQLFMEKFQQNSSKVKQDETNANQANSLS